MTVDERLEALTKRHEALTMNVQLMLAAQVEMRAAQADIHYNHDEMQKELQMLLRSQVLMSESLNKLTGRMTELAEAHRLTEESLRHTDRRMDALILTVDEIVRGRNGGPTVPEV